MLKWFVALMVVATPAFARETGSAYEAMRTIGKQMGRTAFNHVISVIGADGTPQPEMWKIILEDPRARGGMREVEVAGGRIVSDQTRPVVGPTHGATIATSRLNLDSTGAYAVASHTAENSHTVFERVSYTLRTERGSPVWVVTLEDNSSRPVGTIHINANGGSVTRVEGMFRGTNMLQVETDRDEQKSDNGSDGEEFIVKRKLKEMFNRTRDEAEGTFNRVRRSFADFLNR